MNAAKQLVFELENCIYELSEKKLKMATKEEYNSVPVEFCSKATCCSLNIKEDEDGSVYCDDCGGMKVSKAPIAEWEEYWMMAHGEKLLNIKRVNATTETD